MARADSNAFSIRPRGSTPSWLPAVGAAVKANLNGILTDGVSSEIAGGYASRSAPWSHNIGVVGAFYEWNGGAYVPSLGALGALLVHGGGHGGYYGNEVYAFLIAERTWTRLNMPTYPFVLDYENGEYGPGQPMTTHTYGHVQWAPKTGSTHGEFVLVQHASDHDLGGRGADVAHHLDIDACIAGGNLTPGLGWSRGGAFAESPVATQNEGWSAYDSKRHCIYHGHSSQTCPVWKYDLATRTHAQLFSTSIQLDAMAAYSPTLDAVIISKRRTTPLELYGIDCASPTSRINLNFSGTGPPTMGQHGFEWCPPRGAFYAYHWDSSVVWKLTPPAANWKTGTWVWSTVPTQSIAAGSPNGQGGPYSAFRWISRLPNDAFFVVKDKSMNAHVIQLA